MRRSMIYLPSTLTPGMTFRGIMTFPLLVSVFTSFISVLPSAAGTPVLAQRYPISQWPEPYVCPELQLNHTMRCIVTEHKIYVFSGITDAVAEDSHILLGEVELKNAFSLDAYQIEWWTSPNFTDAVFFLAGDDSRLVFNTERRVGYGVSNATAALVSYDPATHELETVALPAQLPEGALPIGGISVIVPQLKMTYYIGSEGEAADIATPVELLAYNYSDNTIVRRALPANRWATVTYIQAGQKDVLVMLGGLDAVYFLPLPMDKVYIYDIAADKGYLQPTTGSVPSPRTLICAVVVSAADNSSHQIHVYGGHRPEDIDGEAIVDNYYILSLPQFIWTRAPSLPKPHTVTRCDRLGAHRMIITVGLREPTVDCVPLLTILDLNTGVTINTFADKAGYVVPHYVVADIGGGGSGGATVTHPVGGYVDGLESVIGATPRESPTCANGQRHDCRQSHHGAIIGGLIAAGVVVLGLVGLWRWRRRPGPDPPEPSEPQMHELADPGPELQSREDGMLTSAQEMPHPVSELQSREDGMQTSAHELPGMVERGNFLVPNPDLRVYDSSPYTANRRI